MRLFWNRKPKHPMIGKEYRVALDNPFQGSRVIVKDVKEGASGVLYVHFRTHRFIWDTKTLFDFLEIFEEVK